MEAKVYRLYGINAAIELLRPGSRWEITNSAFTRWDDPRPCPTWKEIEETMEKIKNFEDSIEAIWLPQDLEKFLGTSVKMEIKD
jgi:hypothetical protein